MPKIPPLNFNKNVTICTVIDRKWSHPLRRHQHHDWQSVPLFFCRYPDTTKRGLVALRCTSNHGCSGPPSDTAYHSSIGDGTRQNCRVFVSWWQHIWDCSRESIVWKTRSDHLDTQTRLEQLVNAVTWTLIPSGNIQHWTAMGIPTKINIMAPVIIYSVSAGEWYNIRH